MNIGISLKLNRLPSSSSGPQKVTNGLFAEFDARDTSTMTLTSGRVDEWRSLTGSHKFVTSSVGVAQNPSYVSTLFGNRGGINFNSKYLDSFAAFSEITAATGHTFIMVLKKTSRNSYFFLARSTTAQTIIGSGTSERIGCQALSQAQEGLPRNSSLVYGFRWDATPANRRMFINGNAIIATEATFGYTVPGAFGKVSVGGIPSSGNQGIMECGGVYCYNRALSDVEIIQMTNYLNAQFGLTTLPSPSWNVCIEGNSLAVGANGTTTSATYDGLINANGSPTAIDCKMFATSGSVISSLNSRAAAVDAYYNTSIPANKRICIVWEIGNEIALNATRTDAEALASLKLYCQNRKATGWKVIVMTALPRLATGSTVNPNYETYRLSVNASVRANAVSEGWADAVADVGNDATIGVTGAETNTTNYSTDKLHLTNTGYGIAKTYVTTAINSVTGL